MMSDRSEIRDSDLAALRGKVADRNYGKYLHRLKLERLRGFADAEVTFDFPVTALVGPNGAGKTTILGAAGLIYKGVPPRRFFAKSGRYDNSMIDWRVEYELIDREVQPRTSITRTASYRRAKWNRDAVDRDVEIFGVTRTLPASERTELTRCIGGTFRGFGEMSFEPSVVEAVEHILGKEAAGYFRVNADKGGKVSLYAAKTGEEQGYSEFHFGAGEASVIRIVSALEGMTENSLVLIEEIENGLHPLATQRLVEYMIDVAKRKSLQAIFTTHSNDALRPLPGDAVWAAFNRTTQQGKLDVAALRTLTGSVNARLAVFVEDSFAEELAQASLRAYSRLEEDKIDIAGTKVHAMGGAGNAERTALAHNANPAITFPAIAILDGDKRGEASLPTGRREASYFPGDGDPEDIVFDDVVDVLDEQAARLTLMLQLASSDQSRVRDVINSRKLTNRDRHVIFSQIGEDLDFTSEIVVQRAFVNCWSQAFPDKVNDIWRPVNDALPRMSASQ